MNITAAKFRYFVFYSNSRHYVYFVSTGELVESSDNSFIFNY